MVAALAGEGALAADSAALVEVHAAVGNNL